MQLRLALAAVLFLAIGACAQVSGALSRDRETQQAQDVLPDGGPPVVNGFYDFEGSCPFEGCGLGDLYALAPVELRERPAIDARVVATVQAGEWVSTLNSINRLRPARGVVIGEVRNLYDSGNGFPLLAVGDVVYAVDYEGEGMTRLWRRGEFISWQETGSDENGVDDGIRWTWSTEEERAADQAAGAGWWLEVQRANGERGWTRNAGDFDCLAQIDPSPRCEEHWAARGR